MKTLPFLSYRKFFGKDGTVYGQRINISWEIFSKLSQEIKDEIAAGYPRKALYAETSGDELFFFKDIEMTHHGKLWICELTHTQSKFILLFLGLKYKVGSYNSYLVIR